MSSRYTRPQSPSDKENYTDTPPRTTILASKKRKADQSASDSVVPRKRGKSSTKRQAVESPSGDLFSVTLDGDDDESVPIYDTCDELRRKINRELRSTGSTQLSFLRDISRAAWPHDPPKIQSKQLSDFLRKHGPTAGSLSRICYGSYVYFEKKRVFENKPKSKHRLEMEGRWKREGGLPRVCRQYFTLGPYDYAYEDKYGYTHIESHEAPL